MKRLPALLVSLYLLAAFMPVPYQSLRAGNDPSWDWAVNVLAGKQGGWGGNRLYSYGPLGYLLYPFELGNNLPEAVAFQAAAHALLCLLVFLLLRDRPPWASLLSGLGLVAASTVWGMEQELWLLSGLLCHFALRRGALAPLAGASALLLFVKFGAGVAALGACGLLFLLLVKRGARWAALALAASVVASVGLGGALLLKSAAELPGWVRGSLELGSGYGSAMSQGGPAAHVVLALCILGVLALALPRVAPVLLPLALLAFKHGFTRQDAHEAHFFGLALAVAAVAVMAEPRRWPALLAVAGLAGAALHDAEWYDAQGALRRAAGFEAAWRIPALARLAEERKRLADTAGFAPDLLPPRWRALIGDATVDVQPSELAMVPANQLHWQPSPTLQFFGAYTPWLDGLQAAHFGGPNAPQFLIWIEHHYDARNLFWETPRTALVLLSAYEVVAREEKMLLLRRRAQPAPLLRERALYTARAATSTEVEVPAQGLVLVRIRLASTAGSALASIFYRILSIFLRVRYEDGSEGLQRLLPPLAGEGALLSPLPRDASELEALWAGKPLPHVKAFHLSGAGLARYGPQLEAEFSELIPVR